MGPHRRFTPTTRRPALLLLESILSIGLTVLLVACFATSLVQYSNLRRETDARRQCVRAATAAIDRIRAGISTVNDADTALAKPHAPSAVELHVTHAPGEGRWAGLVRVRVEAARRLGPSRIVRVALTSYIAPFSQETPR